MKRVAFVLFVLMLAPLVRATHVDAWDVACKDSSGVDCPDSFAMAQTFWSELPRAEHRALLDATIDFAGLPQQLRSKFSLNVYSSTETLTGKDGATYSSVLPLLVDAQRRRQREMSIAGMANLPDMSYALWDLAAGNELCPPSPGGDALDCHNYETHIGWLNANHMLPQSQRWYEHLHALALTQATECRRQADAIPLALRDRYRPYLLACEKQALMLEGVGHHYLQDSWSVGHLWERWGGTEETDFDGDQALGFAIGGFTGLIHGAKAVLDDLPGGPWDDPMCAPHENVTYIDKGPSRSSEEHGVGDIFLPALSGVGTVAEGDRFAPQRRALFGCAISGLRAVYAATSQVHGGLAQPKYTQFDATRDVADDSCWAQRATNKALAEGYGIHRGEAPHATRFVPDANANTFETIVAMQALITAQLIVTPIVAGAPVLWDDPITYNLFRSDASWNTALAIASALDPATRDDTTLAEGGLPSLAGIKPNHFYARGNPAAHVPPAFWADPFPPWSLSDQEDPDAPRKRVLNLFFADANAGQRCLDLDAPQLESYVTAVQEARSGGVDTDTVDARCGQCVQMIAPHLRHGLEGAYDLRREAFCGRVAPQAAAFLYTDEDPGTFTGAEPLTFASLEQAAREKCGCEPDECGNGTDCDGTCVDIQSDPSNCGACGNECESGECNGGICSDACEGGGVATDEGNCGSCGNICDYGQECIEGVCQVVCPTPWDGGAAYYVAYPCGEKRCNCQVEVCIEGECYNWSGPHSYDPFTNEFIPDSYPPEPSDGYCPKEHAWPDRSQDLEGTPNYRCCDYDRTDCVCPSGVPGSMRADGYCYEDGEIEP